MMIKGDLSTIRKLKSTLKRMPVTLAFDVAQRAAPVLTSMTQEAFRNFRTVYGEWRPGSESGGPLDLVRTGTTQRELRFQASGRIVRAVLGTKYARYLIGRYGVLPNQTIPEKWELELRAIVADEAQKALSNGSV